MSSHPSDLPSTIAARVEHELVIKKSRFIATVVPVRSVAEADAEIAALRKRYWDARHNCVALVVGGHADQQRSSDDGEPSGTAGVPMLEVLRQRHLTDLVAVVTRYFGGVLLGAGGLVRAYSHGASLAVAAGGIQNMRLCLEAQLVCDYAQYGWAAPLIAAAGGTVDDTVYTDAVPLRFHLPVGLESRLQSELTEKSAGKLSFTVENTRYYAEPGQK